jgi:hypothetical protein
VTGLGYVALWARAFALTVALEAPVVLPLLRAAQPSRARRVALLLCANLATHPLVWFVFPALPFGYTTMVALAEASVVVVEAVLYAAALERLRPVRAALVALLANAVSLGVGLVVRRFTRWM